MKKNNIDFLDQLVVKVKDRSKGKLGFTYFEPDFFPSEPVNWLEKMTQFFGFGPYQPFIISKQFTSKLDELSNLVDEFCSDYPLYFRLQKRWEDAGHSPESFEKFIVLALYTESIQIENNRKGGRVEVL